MQARAAMVVALVVVQLLAPPAHADPVQPIGPDVAGQPCPKNQANPYKVKSVDQLVVQVSSDDIVRPKALGLAQRRRIAYGVLVGGGLLGGFTALVGASLPSPEPCRDRGCIDTSDHKSYTLAYVGLGIGLASALFAWIAYPNRDDVLEVVNAWNTRHDQTPLGY